MQIITRLLTSSFSSHLCVLINFLIISADLHPAISDFYPPVLTDSGEWSETIE